MRPILEPGGKALSRPALPPLPLRAVHGLHGDRPAERGRLPLKGPTAARRPRELAVLFLLFAIATSSFTVQAFADEPDDGLPAPAPPRKKLPRVLPTVLPPVIMTEFDPRRDGMPFGNDGDYTSPDGNCFGMSLLAVDAYLRRLEEGREGERRPAPTIVRSVDDTNLDLRKAAAAAVLQERTDAHEDDDRDNPRVTQRKASEQIIAALKRIAKTGVPEIMGSYAASEASSAGHAFVLFGYRNGKLQIYDPNFPGETIEWPFDEQKGLARHPRAAEDDELYGPKALVTSTPADRYLAHGDIGWVTSACSVLAAACTDHFPTITATVEPVKPGKNGARVAIVGRISGGRVKTGDGTPVHRPRRIWVAVNGVRVAAGVLQPDGSFRLIVPSSVLTREVNDIRIVATTSDGALAGFLEQKTGPPPAPSETRGAAAALSGGAGR